MTPDLADMPDWFVYAPDGPHRPSVGLGRDVLTYESYCRQCRDPWPCYDAPRRADARR